MLETMAVTTIILLLVSLLATPLLTCKPTPKCFKMKVILKDSLSIEDYKKLYQNSYKEEVYPTPTMTPQGVSTSTETSRSPLPISTQNLGPPLTIFTHKQGSPFTMTQAQNPWQTPPTTIETTENMEISDNNIKCGTVAPSDVQAVIHGHNAAEKSYPWQVYIRSQTTFCGGVLISSRWVLTAAHCTNNTMRILLGTKNLRNHSPNTVIRSIANVITHAQFDRFNNDIALIKMNEDVEFNDYIRPACIPVDENSFEVGENCYLTGWGLIDFKENKYPNELQEVGVDVISNDDCYYAWLMNNRKISSGHLCTSLNTDEPTGACNGDSGGPISCLVNSTFYVAAVASRVEYGCQKKFLPDVYTRVSFYRQWINKTMSEN